jgi:hypothetical protein
VQHEGDVEEKDATAEGAGADGLRAEVAVILGEGAADAAIVAFRLVAKIKKGEKTEVANYLNTGAFLKRDGKWQAVSWQATKMPAENEPKK